MKKQKLIMIALAASILLNVAVFLSCTHWVGGQRNIKVRFSVVPDGATTPTAGDLALATVYQSTDEDIIPPICPDDPSGTALEYVGGLTYQCTTHLDADGNPTLFEATNLEPVATATIPFPTGFDDQGNPVVLTVTIPRSQVVQGALYYHWVSISDLYGNEAMLSLRTEDNASADWTPPDRSGQPVHI